MEALAELIRMAMIRLPDAFSNWSKDACTLIALVPESRPKTCGGFLNVIAGASVRLKFNTMGLNTSVSDEKFDRAAIQILGIVRADPTWALSNNPLLVNDQVSSSIVQSAIEGQSWLTLYFLGRIQRRLNPEVRPSDVLLRDMNFQAVRNNAPTAIVNDGVYSPFALPMNRCLPEEIRIHAASVLDGLEIPNLRCGMNGVI